MEDKTEATTGRTRRGNQERTHQKTREHTWENQWRSTDSILKKKNDAEKVNFASPVENQDTSPRIAGKEDRRVNKGTNKTKDNRETLERNESSKDIEEEDDNKRDKFGLSKPRRTKQQT